MTDSSGFPLGNTHNGDTFILGDLTVQGNILVDNALGQSEYLDSGEYKSIITNVSGITNVSFNSTTRTYYEKQGNLVKLYTSLRITFTSSLASSFTFDITVPALDIFEKKINGAFCIANGGFANQYDADGFANVLDTNGVIRVIFQRLPLDPVSLPFGGDVAGSVILIYKLEGVDVPASVLLAGGSGSGDVKNPMLETLDGGGFNIINVGSIVANSVVAPNVVTNPLSVDLNLSNNNITNVGSVDATTLNATTTNTTNILVDTIGTITQSNLSLMSNIDMGGRNILFPSNISGVSDIQNTITPLTIKGNPLYLQNQVPGTGIKVDDDFDFQNVSNSKIRNCNEIKTVGQQLTIIGGPLLLENDSSQTDILISNSIDLNGRDIKDVTNITANVVNTYNLQGRDDLLNIVNADFPVIMTGSKIELRSNPPGIGKVEVYTDIDMNNNDIINIGSLNSINTITKTLNTINYIRLEADFGDLTTLSGVYVIIGEVTITTQGVIITGPITISGYNSLSKLIFNVPTLPANTNCVRNVGTSAHNLYIQDIEISKISVEGAGLLSFSDVFFNNIIRVSNVLFNNCNANYVLRIDGWKTAEILNNTFLGITGAVSGSMIGLDNCVYTLVESNEIIENVYASPVLSVLGTCNYIHINNNIIVTKGATSKGVQVFNSAIIERIIVSDNIFNAIDGALLSNLLLIDTQIHKGTVCTDNTNIEPCTAALEGLVNNNTVYTATVAGVFVPINLTGFTVGTISRFVPTLNPYEFAYDGKDPIRCLINANCQANHSTGGFDTVQFGLKQNNDVNVFVQAQIAGGPVSQIALTTVVTANFGDTFQFVCKNLSVGTNNSGFRAQSLNASLVQI